MPSPAFSVGPLPPVLDVVAPLALVGAVVLQAGDRLFRLPDGRVILAREVTLPDHALAAAVHRGEVTLECGPPLLAPGAGAPPGTPARVLRICPPATP